MRYRSLFIRWMLLLAAVVFAVSCSDDDPATDGQVYGYAQFHLAKKSPMVRAEQLEYLRDASKIRVDVLADDGSRLSQALSITAIDEDISEYGMQTEKWMLLTGAYTVIGYEIYDGVENPLLVHVYDEKERPVMDIKPGGLLLQEISVNVIGRGQLKFQLVKDESFEPDPEVRSTEGSRQYPFFRIVNADITIKNLDDTKETTFEKLPVKYKTIGEDRDDDIYYTGICTCDSIISMPAGRYSVVKYVTYLNKNEPGEINQAVKDNEFYIPDNGKVTADVPVTLNEAADYIKDAYNLYKIWLALDGPNWYYRGLMYPKGSNWKFDNCDIDLWLAQPGVQILPNGRIASLNIEGFGAKGEMPDELGLLSELRSLTLGTPGFNTSDGTNENIRMFAGAGGQIVTGELLAQQSKELFRSFKDTYTTGYGHPLERFSPDMQYSFSKYNLNHNAGRPSNLKPFVKSTQKRPDMPSINPQNYASLITKLPSTIGQLKELKSLFVSYGKLEGLPDEIAGCEALTDICIFTCPEMKEFPKAIAGLPKLTGLIFSNNGGVDATSMYEGLKEMNTKGAEDPDDGHPIQIIEMPNQPLETLPDMRNLKRLSLLDITNCGVKVIEQAFGKDILFSTFAASHNEIKELPVDEDGYFMGLHGDMEEMNFSYNKFTEFPNVFLGNSVFILGTVDFTHNQISKLGGGENWKGINTEILDLSYNLFEEFPAFYTDNNDNVKNCSQVNYLLVAGCRIASIEEEDFEGTYTHYLRSLDLSQNFLEELPTSLYGKNFPFFYGIDLSYNRFSKFAYQPLNCPTLQTFVFNGQRDKNGNRIMQEWPDKVATHGVGALFLRSNDIRKINDNESLRGFIGAYDISDNPNITINVSSICDLITYQQIMFVYDPEQDIRGCDALDLK